MAVSPARRGSGLGTALFGVAADSARGRTLLLEVEAGDEPAARRRKAFYRRLGCRELPGVDYRMPRVAEAAPPPMSLMAFGENGEAVERSVLRAWLVDIFRRVYAVPARKRPSTPFWPGRRRGSA